jgi:DNA-binding CsgD family transcriptional regulator
MMIRLTPQQHQCVALLAQVMQDKAIARELGIECGTVKQHLLMARAKARVNNRTELAVLYVRGDIVPPGGVTA